MDADNKLKRLRNGMTRVALLLALTGIMVTAASVHFNDKLQYPKDASRITPAMYQTLMESTKSVIGIVLPLGGLLCVGVAAWLGQILWTLRGIVSPEEGRFLVAVTSGSPKSYFLPWLVFFLATIVLTTIASQAVGWTVGFILGTLKVDMEHVRIICSIVGGVLALVISFGAFRWVVTRMIVERLTHAASLRRD